MVTKKKLPLRGKKKPAVKKATKKATAKKKVVKKKAAPVAKKSIYSPRKVAGCVVSAPWWHVHHQQLWEYSHDPKGRLGYIKRDKAKREIPTRVKLMRPMVLDAHQKALLLEFNKAEAAYIKHGKSKSYNYVESARLSQLRDRARLALNNAIEAKLDAMHTAQCKEKRGCPWNGKTIFPGQSSF